MMGNAKVRCYFDYLCFLYYLGMNELVLWWSFMGPKYPLPSVLCLFPHYVGLGKRVGGEREIIIYRGTPAQIVFGGCLLSFFQHFGGREWGVASDCVKFLWRMKRKTAPI